MTKDIIRKCRACNTLKNRDELIKITKLNNGLLKISPNSKELGRSVYVCKNSECIKKVIKKNGIKSALKYSNADEIQKIHEELLNLLK